MVFGRSEWAPVAASFGLAALLYAVTPTTSGYDDVGALIARQPQVAAHWHQHLLTSPIETVRAGIFALPQPIGTAFPGPAGLTLASFERSNPDVVGSIRASLTRAEPVAAAPLVFPSVNRAGKGDRLSPQPVRPPAVVAPVDASSEEDTPRDLQQDILDAIARERAGKPAAPAIDEIEAAMRFVPFPEYDVSLSLELHPQIPRDDVPAEVADGDQPDLSILDEAADPDPTQRTARLFFDRDPIGVLPRALAPWSRGEAPVLVVPQVPADLDIKPAARDPGAGTPGPGDGVTVAGKGEVTGDGRRPKSPAERLGLEGKARAKAEQCLATAVYFEAATEPVRGQMVAQVVMNRVFSGYYPSDVCGVVYQNAHRHRACQFSFACDGVPDRITSPQVWARAKRIAIATLDGAVWLPEVGKATHYHASYVHPRWVRAMHKLSRIGVHTFYRPRRWGDGADAPSWGSAQATAEAAAKM